ncbi:uncharacterized protein LY89DRAFT_732198 [Mollisia scopiformis]|uniref:Uncharacterized protein n=1 Tax=Mollisia scopiformis TaxID=149040 RepID=A0A194XFU0_MOLSC|nr:uncharacterized protein LY89DRAFT_732198 [Mollisia scopiformis]KUJ18642.1 hypothetical protein LY89DRAFT_732198 [Mollisia scopiformis]
MRPSTVILPIFAFASGALAQGTCPEGTTPVGECPLGIPCPQPNTICVSTTCCQSN